METLNTILAICGGISIVGGAVAVVWKWVAPAFRLSKRVEILEDHDRRDFEAMKRFNERDSLILEALITILDCQISENNVEELKKTRKKISEFLVHSQT